MTSARERLKRVMSPVMIAPTMRPPATMPVPTQTLMVGPGAGPVSSSPMSWRVSSVMTDQPTRMRNSGTVTLASHCMPTKPKATMPVTMRPKMRLQAHTGRAPGMRASSDSAEIADWMPNQPIRLMPIARPTSEAPISPKPVQRASSEVFRPSRWPMKPTTHMITSRMIEPNRKARKASPKVMLYPRVAPRRNCESAETCPNRCTAIPNQGLRASGVTRESAKSSACAMRAMLFLREEGDGLWPQ